MTEKETNLKIMYAILKEIPTGLNIIKYFDRNKKVRIKINMNKTTVCFILSF